MLGVIVPLYFIKTFRGSRDWLWEKQIFLQGAEKNKLIIWKE